MIAFAPCKINIGLHVLEPRGDGYHNIESYFYPVPLYDILEIKRSNKNMLVQTGIVATPKHEDNLVFRALKLAQKNYPISSVKIHLHKQIPVQAGLGGGSSDAVATLKIVDRLFNLNIPDEKMHEMALELGSDCPFFIKARAAKVMGRGEMILDSDLSLQGMYIVIIKPSFSMQTQNAYESMKSMDKNHIPSISIQNIAKWQQRFRNDFEQVFKSTNGKIEEIINYLLKQGAVYASLTGSGSAVYGIFATPQNIRFNSSYFTWMGRLQ